MGSGWTPALLVINYTLLIPLLVFFDPLAGDNWLEVREQGNACSTTASAVCVCAVISRCFYRHPGFGLAHMHLLCLLAKLLCLIRSSWRSLLKQQSTFVIIYGKHPIIQYCFRMGRCFKSYIFSVFTPPPAFLLQTQTCYPFHTDLLTHASASFYIA